MTWIRKRFEDVTDVDRQVINETFSRAYYPDPWTNERETMNENEKNQPESALPLQPPTPMTLKERCDYLRGELRHLEQLARQIKDMPDLKGEQSYLGQHGEMIAQSMLAVRHLEDARMRIGKVLQYAGDGVSIYDKA